jgi:cell division ATPase FtsA
LKLKKAVYAGQTPSGLVVTGGGARTIGISDAAKRMLAMPVRIGYPKLNIKGIIDEIQDTSFSTVVGLAEYGKNIEAESSLPFGFSFPKLPFGQVKFNKFFRKQYLFLSPSCLKALFFAKEKGLQK